MNSNDPILPKFQLLQDIIHNTKLENDCLPCTFRITTLFLSDFVQVKDSFDSWSFNANSPTPTTEWRQNLSDK